MMRGTELITWKWQRLRKNCKQLYFFILFLKNEKNMIYIFSLIIKTVKLDEKRKDVNKFIKYRMSYQIANFYW